VPYNKQIVNNTINSVRVITCGAGRAAIARPDHTKEGDCERMTPRHVRVGDIEIGNDLPLVFIVGPNTLESRAHALEMSAALSEIARRLGIALIYKTSFDKANRSSITGARGIGLNAGLPILAELRETTGLRVLTDIHSPEQCAPVAEVVDVLQTPAFLCRQTD